MFCYYSVSFFLQVSAADGYGGTPRKDLYG